MSKIGVIGAGLMGNGIAHTALLSGFDVTLVDAFEAALPKAIATMTKNMDRQVQKSTITPEARDAALARLTTSTDYEAFRGADLIIEAAPEREELKQLIYKTLAPIIGPETILASNTSSISITRLAAMTGRPAALATPATSRTSAASSGPRMISAPAPVSDWAACAEPSGVP